MAGRKNVILIVSDTLRKDHLGCYGNKIVRTENIDALAKRSTVFERCYAGSHPTVSARADLLTGKWTFTHQVWGPLPPNEVRLPELLHNVGYSTFAAVDTPFYMRDGYGYDRGFDIFIENYGQNMFNKGSRNEYIAVRRQFEEDYFAPKTFREAGRIIERNRGNPKPFFMLIDTWDPHEPWDPPSWYAALYKPNYDGRTVLPTYSRTDDGSVSSEDLEIAHACYCGEITMVDRALGTFLDRVADMDLLKDTVIVFLSDHGFYFGEHGIFGKAVLENIPEQRRQGKEKLDVNWLRSPLYEEVVHVPLMIYHPDHEPNRVGSLVSLVDIMPTILDLAGIEKIPFVQGRSITNGITEPQGFAGRDFVVTSVPLQNPKMMTKMVDSFERGIKEFIPSTVTTAEWSLLYAAKGEKSELYDLRNDPRQQIDVIQENKDVAKALHAKFVELLRSSSVSDDLLGPRTEITF